MIGILVDIELGVVLFASVVGIEASLERGYTRVGSEGARGSATGDLTG